jgi:hypothetical protein
MKPILRALGFLALCIVCFLLMLVSALASDLE